MDGMEEVRVGFEDIGCVERDVIGKAIQDKKPVRLYFVTGYQADVVIEKYDMESILCRKVDRDKLWLVYLDKVCTIEV